MPSCSSHGLGRLAPVLGAVIGAALSGSALAGGKVGGKDGGQVQIPTTIDDFFQPGTQPEPNDLLFAPIQSNVSCEFCHGSNYLQDSNNEPHEAWTASLMAQSARDPVWHAALAIANQDAHDAGEYCIRCHAPGAWLDGRSLPADGSAFITSGFIDDFDGINCHFCHRMVNPVFEGDSPDEDASILASLTDPPGAARGNGRFVVDPDDVRRGPYEDIAMNPEMNIHGVPVIHSPFHRRSEMCATCHDLRNPAFSKQKDGSYVLNGLGSAHPTQNPYDMMPEQTTYSEWEHSQFANGGVLFADGRFGGNHPTGIMEECQDCHMPDQIAGGCFFYEQKPWFERQDLPQHSFAGANTWVLNAIRALYSEFESGLSDDLVQSATARTIEMLRNASDLEAHQYGYELKVRVINYSGHKLPTGYPEGRRMWLNVQFYDDGNALLTEHGAYDHETADLTTNDTKVYEALFGMDEAVAGAAGLSPGPSSHLVLNNVLYVDNRIPPIGFTNADYEQVGAPVAGAVYEDGQHWDTTSFPVPRGADHAVVTVYYQPMTKEYVEFLRDANTAPAPNDGTILYDLWLDPDVGNKVPPLDLDSLALELFPPRVGDIVPDGLVDALDFLELIGQWGPCPGPSLCTADLNCDGTIDALDFLDLIANWTL